MSCRCWYEEVPVFDATGQLVEIVRPAECNVGLDRLRATPLSLGLDTGPGRRGTDA